jgi:hypothetical protein
MKKLKVRGVKPHGERSTLKPIASIHDEKLEGWSDKRSGRARQLLG